MSLTLACHLKWCFDGPCTWWRMWSTGIVDFSLFFEFFITKKISLQGHGLMVGALTVCLLALLQADLSVNLQDDSNFFYGVSSQYESSENMIITSSTKVCSFGKQVVEKVEVRTTVILGQCNLPHMLHWQKIKIKMLGKRVMIHKFGSILFAVINFILNDKIKMW